MMVVLPLFCEKLQFIVTGLRIGLLSGSRVSDPLFISLFAL
jgi:hypothetical protein